MGTSGLGSKEFAGSARGPAILWRESGDHVLFMLMDSIV